MRFLYKCRLCGAIDNHLGMGGSDDRSQMQAIKVLCDATHDNPQQFQAPRMLSIHNCGNGRTGIADLIGCEP